MAENRQQRSYEVSIWSLQDDFIAVLKAANLESKGQITNGSMKLNTDGTQELTFSIPMYIYDDDMRIENPLWCNTRNGNLLINMRKIKVIFNKNTIDQKVFDFIITKIKERHENDELYCDVTCEGLAFHELGKTGYRIELSTDVFYKEDEDWFKEYGERQNLDGVPARPVGNLQYWLNKFLEPIPQDTTNRYANQWYYQINMDWSAYAYGYMRKTDAVYEQPYASSWDKDLKPLAMENFKQKERMIDLKESNIYNLTQDIAKTFGIYCRYQLGYDENYHIISRTIIFYNNFISEKQGYLSLTYPYSTSAVSREIDSTDLTTKLFVSSVENSSVAAGQSSIINVEANRSGEDYILNFDYLTKIGGVTQEQQEAIVEYQKKMHQFNAEMMPLQQELLLIDDQIPTVEGKLTVAKNAITLDLDRIDAINKLISQLDMADGTEDNLITRDAGAAQSVVVRSTTEAQGGATVYWISLPDEGVQWGTVTIYKTINYTLPDNRKLSNPIEGAEAKQLKPVYDGFNNLIEIRNIPQKPDETLNIVYLTYSYSPMFSYTNIKRTWQTRLAKDKSDEQIHSARLETLKTDKETKEAQLATLREQKNQAIKSFQRLMGPALREGYWQPEDFKDTGNKFVDTYEIGTVENYVYKSGKSQKSAFLWDINLQEDQRQAYYSYGVEEAQRLYPHIILSQNALRAIIEHKDQLEKMSVIYQYDIATEAAAEAETDKGNDTNDNTQVITGHKWRSLQLNSGYQFAFIYLNIFETQTIAQERRQLVAPVLLLTGASKLSEQEQQHLLDADKISLGTLDIKTETDTTDSTEDSMVLNAWVSNSPNSVSKNLFIRDQLNYDKYVQVCYPRFQVNSLFLKTTENQLNISYNAQLLAPYEDYYTYIKDNKYYITIKPYTIIKNLKLGATAADRFPANTDQIKDVVNRSSRAWNINIPFLNPDDSLSTRNTLAFQFALSNADISIYLDALQVLKQNSMPKVEYSITPAVINDSFVHTAYKNLARIVNINDNDLKLENAQGYISQLTLNLDSPGEDSITVANYKTKFEDLFSTIVAQTEAMKKSEYTISLASNLFDLNGQLSGAVVQDSLSKVDLNYQFNNGTLIIDEKNGIWGISNDGVVAMRGGGIFTATQKNQNNEWIWNTGIVPQGINAELITTGQLDTKKIKIYAGDRPRFQLNEDGLFAYKTFMNDYNVFKDVEESDELNTRLNERTKDLGYDPSQYIVFNSDGIFLRMEPGSITISDDGRRFEQLQQTVDRVSLTWDGLTIRNNAGEPVFYSSPSTGDLTIAGFITTASGFRVSTGAALPDDMDISTSYTLPAFIDLNITNYLNNVSSNVNSILTDSNSYVQELRAFRDAVVSIQATLDKKLILRADESIEIFSGNEDSISHNLLRLNQNGIWLGSDATINLFSGTLNDDASSDLNGFGTFARLSADKLTFGHTITNGTGDNATTSNTNALQLSQTGIKLASIGISNQNETQYSRYHELTVAPNGIKLASTAIINGGELGSFIQLTPEALLVGSSTEISINSTNMGLHTYQNPTAANADDRHVAQFRLGPAGDEVLYFRNKQLLIRGELYPSQLILNNTKGIMRLESVSEDNNNPDESKPFIKFTQGANLPYVIMNRYGIKMGYDAMLRLNNADFLMQGTSVTDDQTGNVSRKFQINSGICVQIGGAQGSSILFRYNPNYQQGSNDYNTSGYNTLITDGKVQANLIRGNIGKFTTLQCSGSSVITAYDVQARIIVSDTEPAHSGNILWIKPVANSGGAGATSDVSSTINFAVASNDNINDHVTYMGSPTPQSLDSASTAGSGIKPIILKNPMSQSQSFTTLTDIQISGAITVNVAGSNSYIQEQNNITYTVHGYCNIPGGGKIRIWDTYDTQSQRYSNSHVSGNVKSYQPLYIITLATSGGISNQWNGGATATQTFTFTSNTAYDLSSVETLYAQICIGGDYSNNFQVTSEDLTQNKGTATARQNATFTLKGLTVTLNGTSVFSGVKNCEMTFIAAGT